MEYEDDDLHENEHESFSDDPDEQIRIENELLRLRLQAETGAQFSGMEEVPPEVEQLFLQNILEFERQLSKVKEATVYEILGQPEEFANEGTLTDGQVEHNLEALNQLLEENRIQVDFGTDYPARLKYKFITEELFQHKTQVFDIPDMVSHFIYEEFHPNHDLALRETTDLFMEHWFGLRVPRDDNFLYAQELVDKDGKDLDREKFFDSMQYLFDAYISLTDASYRIDELDFKTHPEDETLLVGSTEGQVSYKVRLESGEDQLVDGRFRLLCCCENGQWEIVCVRMPGLN
ncbi:MAG: hypothetical protein QM642_07160 [Edaphocola sp.]